MLRCCQEAYLEPKWTFDGEPYKGGWCRPQTDGPRRGSFGGGLGLGLEVKEHGSSEVIEVFVELT